MAETADETAFYPSVVHHYPSDFRHGRISCVSDLADEMVGGDVMEIAVCIMVSGMFCVLLAIAINISKMAEIVANVVKDEGDSK